MFRTGMSWGGGSSKAGGSGMGVSEGKNPGRLVGNCAQVGQVFQPLPGWTRVVDARLAGAGAGAGAEQSVMDKVPTFWGSPGSPVLD